MKKIFIAAVCAVFTVSAMAEGYQVNTFSAKQEGMGHVGVAMKLGAESLIFNPAAVSYMDKTMEISGSLSAISSNAYGWLGGKKYESQNPVSTPMNISAAFRIYDNLYAGVTFYTPYGSGIDWTKNWPGAVLNQSVQLKVFDVQPTVSWRILPNLSIGAGVMIAWGSVNLNKGLVDANALDRTMALMAEATKLEYAGELLQYYGAMLQGVSAPAPTAPQGGAPQPYGEVSPANVNLTGKSKLAVGFNVGAMWDINKQWTVGASFRSKMNMHVTAGDVSVEYANEQAVAVLGETLNNLNSTNFDASMPCPYVLTAGVAYKPIERLTLAFDVQLNGWSAYKSLKIQFANQEQFNQNLTKNYKDAMTYHLGGQFAMTDRLDLRAGLMIDTNPCDLNYYNPETPGTTKWEPSVGLSFRPVKGLSIDVAFMYVHGKKQNNTQASYDNFMADSYNAGLAKYNAGLAQYNAALNQVVSPTRATLGQVIAAQGWSLPQVGETFEPMEKQGTIKGAYQVRAFIPAIGISYSF